MPSLDPCKALNCTRTVGPKGAHGYCPPHYAKWRRYGDPHHKRQPKHLACSVCGHPNYSSGFCKLHYSRQSAGRTMYTWKEQFIMDNPPTWDYGKIPLSKNLFTIVDREDYDRFIEYEWSALCTNHLKYAVRTQYRPDGSHYQVLLHREILELDDDLHADHIDGNGLNNRRANLRPATPSQNSWNMHVTRKRTAQKTSQFKGVSWFARDNKWQAQLSKDYKHYHLGTFDDELEAAVAYNQKAIELHGEFAVLNHIPDRP